MAPRSTPRIDVNGTTRSQPVSLQPSLDSPPVASPASATHSPSPDYPEPFVLKNAEGFDWHANDSPAENYSGLGRRLAQVGDLFRNPSYGDGLLLASRDPRIPPIPIRDADTLGPIIVDRLSMRVFKDGKAKGTSIPKAHLKQMLRSELFLIMFPPLDAVVNRRRYLLDFTLTSPGFNDGGPGQRLLQVGEGARIEHEPAAIRRFLDVMAFETEADRTNAAAEAITVLLGNFWPGGKPCLVVTSSKSHGGKETVVSFAAGTTRSVSISYQATDWALERSFVGAVKDDPEIGLVDIENARLDRGQQFIRSAFLERLVTDAEPLLFSTGSGAPSRRRNDLVVAITSNFGQLSEDLLNRGLPIHLTPVGDVAGRSSPIGNPKLEYLPSHRDRIEAELLGMVERRKEAGQPLDKSVKHPCGPWAETVGGILQANGFAGFLDNYSQRRASDDPARKALGLLGAARPGEWLRAAEWSILVAKVGLTKALISGVDRESDRGRERGIGVVLSTHDRETFHVQEEGRLLELKLEKARRRFEEGGEAQVRYRFDVVSDREIPGDPEDDPRSGSREDPEGRGLTRS